MDNSENTIEEREQRREAVSVAGSDATTDDEGDLGHIEQSGDRTSGFITWYSCIECRIHVLTAGNTEGPSAADSGHDHHARPDVLVSDVMELNSDLTVRTWSP